MIDQTVYVDESVFPFRGKYYCHMYSQDINALHEMADKIGLRRSWFQDRPGFPHYDLSPTKRELAVRDGATETSCREIIRIARSNEQ